MVHHYIGPMIWDTNEPDLPFWRFYDLGGIDLRPLSAQGQAGGSPQGVALHVTRDRLTTEPDYYSLGEDLNRVQSQAELREIESVLGLTSGDLSGTLTLLEAITNALTLHGDATGRDRWKPLMPSKRGNQLRMEIHLPGHSMVVDQPFTFDSHQGAPSVLAVLREDFARIKRHDRGFLDRRALLKRPGWDHYKRVLGAWAEHKYGVPAELIIPGEESLSPRTTITESFPGDTADLSDGNQDLAWSIPENAWSVTSGEAINSSVRASARADVDLGSDDHFSQGDINCTWSNVFDFAGVAVRFDAAANNFYAGCNSNRAAIDTHVIFKVTAGSRSELDRVAGTITPVATLKMDINGSSLEMFQDTVSVATATDTSFTGQLRCGMYALDNGGAATTNCIGNWSADDGISGAPAVAAPSGHFHPMRRR